MASKAFAQLLAERGGSSAFTRCGVEFRSVQADAGAIGGAGSEEFMVIADSGEDEILYCEESGYAANVEKADSIPAAAPECGDPADLDVTDNLAAEVLERLMAEAPADIQQQMQDNVRWIREAKANKLVVGSQARILYADAQGRAEIASAFNDAIKDGRLMGPVVLGRDHHDVSGTDSPYRETSNIYDGSAFTADMAVQNFVGDGFRGATWISLHNGGGVGWGEVMNGGFGMLIDGSADSERRLRSMLHWDVNNGIARRSWARNKGAQWAIDRAMEMEPRLKVTRANHADDDLIADALS